MARSLREPGGARDAGERPPVPAGAQLALRDVAKRWDPARPPVLDRVSLALDRGSLVTIRGRNGAGKTTLLRIACGLIAPDAGQVWLAGHDPERERAEFQRRVGFLAAGNSGLYGRLSVADHLEFWARIALLPRARRAPAIAAVREAFALAELGGGRVDRLSMGQRQRLRLALAFLHEPEVVLLDEPTTSLDEDAVALLAARLEDLRARGGAAIVCVPTGEAPPLPAERAYAIADGRLEPA